MTWEAERYNWSRLRAAGSASGVPKALVSLQSATSEQEAQEAYWNIDNTVVLQGSLYEAALPATACAVGILPRCTAVARPWCLELLVQLGSGQPDPSELVAGNTNLRELCIHELCRGVAIYFDLLENGNDIERGWCVDLLGLCARVDSSLKSRFKWNLERMLMEPINDELRKLSDNWLQELAATESNDNTDHSQ